MGSLYAFRQHPDRRIAWRNGSPESIAAWEASLLRLTGCDRNGYVFVNEPTLFRDIVFPVPGLMPDVWLTQEQADAFAVFEREPRKGLRVWLSRSKIGSDNLVFTNEREMEELLSSRGWMIFHPEEHSMEEQLEVFASGEVVMGCIGSAFHTLLLMKNPRSRYIVVNRMNGEREAHNLQFDLIAKARTGNYYIWDVPKHDAPPLRRRKTHHSWPWYAFDLDVIRRALDVSDDFAGTMDCPGMVPISARETTNSVGPLLCRLDISLWDRLYYFYRRLRKVGRPAKEAWVSFQQRLWKSFR